MSDAEEALHRGAALLDLSERGRIEATGDDRARLLHALTTNHIQQLKPGQGAYAFFLTAQGRILADAHILCFDDKLLLDVEPETRANVLQHVEHYIIADDVVLEDVTETTFALGLEGPGAAALLEGLGAALPAEPEAHTVWDGYTVARIAFTGGPGFRLFGPAAHKPAIWDRLVSAGAVRATMQDAQAVRIGNGLPRYGEDISNTTLPQETGIPQALHFNKGCYLGQEIVERIRSRGHVNKALVALTVDTETPVAPGTKVTAASVEAGEITSSAYSPTAGKVVAIAMLRVQNAGPNAALETAGFSARVRAGS